MSETSEMAAIAEAALSEGASIRKVLALRLASTGNETLVAAQVDLDPDLTMREISVILHQARRRVREALPQVTDVFIEPEVWVDPDAKQPTTSTVVMLGLD